MYFARIAALVAATLPLTTAALACATEDQINSLFQQLHGNYGDILPDLTCEDAMGSDNVVKLTICESDDDLAPLGQLAAQAYVYAYENATGRETDHANPPRDEAMIAARDACTDAECICDAMKTSINDSLGGLSPFGG